MDPNDIDWLVSTEEDSLIDMIVTRACNLMGALDPEDVAMDIIATHKYITELDLERMLRTDDLTLAHDVLGIRTHLDRETVRLVDYFRPRCALREST